MKVEKQKRKIYFMPRTRLGKVAFWLVIIAILIIFGQYWLTMLFEVNHCDANGICYSDSNTILNIFKIVTSLIAGVCVIIGGVISILSILKYRDRAIFLFITGLIGLLAILFVLGELLVAH